MKKNLNISITCGEKTCGSDIGEFCEFLRQTHSGQKWLCGIFGTDAEEYTILLKGKDGWLLRCAACLHKEIHPEPKPDNTYIVLVEDRSDVSGEK